MRRVALFAALGFLAAGAGSARAQDAAQAHDPAPLDIACANPRLPPAILDGTYAGVAKPLSLIEAGAPAAELRLAVAADEHARELGLMCVTRLRPQRGMIFVFAQTADWNFWMKNTLIALDMVWVEADGTVDTVAARVPASTRETPDAAVARRLGHGLFTIELPAGEAARDGIVRGAHVRLPELRAAP